MKCKIQIPKEKQLLMDFHAEECKLGYLKSDETHFYTQILNGSSGYLIYYFCYELLDINFIPTNNVQEFNRPFANIENERSQRPQKRKHDSTEND
jgi:hypothetical protein